jgi:hypothetical protein
VDGCLSIGAAKRHIVLYIMYGGVLETYKEEWIAFATSNTVIRFTPNKPLPSRLVVMLLKPAWPRSKPPVGTGVACARRLAKEHRLVLVAKIV